MRALLFLITVAAAAQSWIPQQSGTPAALRGVSAVSPMIAWASGSKGTFLRTADGGTTWQASVVTGAADLDFRDIETVNADERIAFLLSSGPGALSRIYKTTDGGERWTPLFTNPDPMGFFDAISLWDATHGIVLGDPVDGRFVLFATSDGVSWRRLKGPAAQAGEGAFAASGTCLFTRGTREVWFGTGGPRGARVFHSTDGGETWSVAKTPIRNDSANAGIFSLAFSSALHGVAVGGDYTKAAETGGNLAITEDGGKTWTAPAGPAPAGYRSAVAYLTDRKLWMATGLSGSDVSLDGGKTWKPFDTGNYNAMSFGAGGSGWAVGPNGAIAKFKSE
jgi:photosystem II stability/assembly factor-like uncharacterized protein